MRNAVPLFAAAFVFACASAQAGNARIEDLVRPNAERFPYRQDGLWGFIDSQGKVAIEAKFDELWPYYYRRAPFDRNDYEEVYFSEGKAPVREGNQWGYIDARGRWVIRPQFTAASHFMQGHALVALHKRVFFINDQGKPAFKGGFSDANPNAFQDDDVLRFEGVEARTYVEAFDFVGGMAPVRVFGEGWGYQGFFGKEDIQPSFELAMSFWGEMAPVCVMVKPGQNLGPQAPEGKLEPLGGKEEKIGPEKEGSGKEEPKPGALVRRWGYIDKTGAFVFQPEYEEARYFFGKCAVVKKDGLYGMLDRNGALCVPARYEALYEYQDDLARFKRDGKWGYLDKAGQEGIAPKFEDARDFCGKLAAAKSGGLWGYLSPDGAWKIKPQFEAAGDFSEKRAGVQFEGKWGYVDEDGGWTVRPTFDGTKPYRKGLGNVRDGDRWGYVDAAGTWIWKPTR